MKTVINIVNYIRAKELNHRKFKSLLEQLEKQNNKVYPELQDDGWWCLLAFLSDIAGKLNSLNRSLQGENSIVSQTANKVFAFEEKLSIYHEVQNRRLQNFPTMIKATEDHIDISEENCCTI